MRKHPVKQQKQTDIDSLANVAYEKWYAKNVQPKTDALEVKKFDDTYLKRDESLPVYNTQQHTTNILKGTGMTGEIIERVKPTFVQKFKNFSSKVKNFLSAHKDRYKKQSEVPMPKWNSNDYN